MSDENPTTALTDLKKNRLGIDDSPDYKIDMFSMKGFELAQRIGKSFAASDAVPAIFRSHNSKKDGNGNVTWIENTSALGNCIVAIETAQAVGMSITAVMQNANVIEGRLTWSGKFIIAAVNASHRFSPLRFRITNKGIISASYREKGSWNNQKRGFDFTDKTVEIENIECVAWAYVMVGGRATTEVIEGAPVSIKMAVEEGWYGKAGSKWQTEMKHLMLQYRAGSYFGNIHAPDVVMGMGRTTEEVQDFIDFEPQPDGSHAVNVDALRAAAQATAKAAGAATTVRDNSQAEDVDAETGEIINNKTAADPATAAGGATASNTTPESEAGTAQAGPTSETSSPAASDDDSQKPTFTYAQVNDAMTKATSIETLDIARDMIAGVANSEQQDELRGVYKDHVKRLNTPKPRTRAAAAPGAAME